MGFSMPVYIVITGKIAAMFSLTITKVGKIFDKSSPIIYFWIILLLLYGHMKNILFFCVIFAITIYPQVKFSADFDSGNINTVTTTDSVLYTVTSKADIVGRWFYFRITGVRNKFIKVKVTNSDVNRAVYSYDNRNFETFSAAESPSMNLFQKTYEKDTVYVAYYVPYSYGFLQERIAKWKTSSYVKVDTLGFTPMGFPIQEIRITDSVIPDSLKNHVWIHARTHPSETPSSWHFDGLVEQILENDDVMNFYRGKIVYHCIPFTNPDGVYYGKSRVNYSSVDVESNWNKTDDQTSQEVRILKKRMSEINAKKQIVVFQNLHSQASEFCTFWIHTAGSTTDYFYRKQLQFCNLNTSGNAYFKPSDYSYSSLSMTFPEGWLWSLNREATLALTYETPYDYYSSGALVTLSSLKELGTQSVYAISEYLELSHPKYYLLDNKSIASKWKVDSSGTEFYGRNYAYTLPGTNAGEAVFTTDVIEKGNYDVYAWWPSNSSNAYDAKITIKAGADNTLLQKSQKINGRQWNFLKNVNLDSSGKISIAVSDTANGTVVADAFKVVYKGLPLSVEKNEVVKDYQLFPNYPNPFNPVTTIKWQMNITAKVTLKIFDVLGREVKTLYEGERGAGVYTVQFDGQNLSSGVYYYSLIVGEHQQTKGMLLLK